MKTINGFLEFGINFAERFAKKTGSVQRLVKKVAIDGSKNPAVRKLAPGATNPVLNVGYLTRAGNNAKGNYTVFNLTVKDGEKVLNQGIFSVAENGNVIKYRSALGENGQKLRVHGFWDKSQRYAADDWQYLAQRKGDDMRFLAESGQKFRTDAHVSRNFIGQTVSELKSLGANVASNAKNCLQSLV